MTLTVDRTTLDAQVSDRTEEPHDLVLHGHRDQLGEIKEVGAP